MAEPATIDVKNLDGSSAGSAALSLRIADNETSKGLVHRYLVMVRQNARRGTASTLTRSEVRGGGRKPYKQKGTGNARIGTIRTPLRPGGGVAFGPKPRDWSIDMNKKEKRLAFATALQSAAGDMVVVEDFAGKFEEIKTKSLVGKLAAMGVDVETEKALLILSEANEYVYLSGRNIEGLAINTANAVQVYDVLAADRIVVEKSALAYLNEYYGSSSE
ncbi:hypothetical protein Ndes2526B_g03974 [Nannochloris sp. 'desiccata']|nr:hypothetical protein KSW81_006049 [Chlorella desiccata (nom. nud.)]KAH7621146.1 putative 50S ribosomal protein L4 [Chlorella desiccata (nom. nud.)]